MNYEEAKAIIAKMAVSSAAPQEEAVLEEYARREWRSREASTERAVMLGQKFPNGSFSQRWYLSVRECLEDARAHAEAWCDILRYHPLLGEILWEEDEEIEYEEIYALEYQEEVGPAEGNFVTVSIWNDGRDETLARFRCAEGRIMDRADPRARAAQTYQFAGMPRRCDVCTAINGIRIVCPVCLEDALEAGVAIPSVLPRAKLHIHLSCIPMFACKELDDDE